MERNRNYRRTYNARTYPFTSENTAKMSVFWFMGYLKEKGAMMIFSRHANLKYKFGNRNFGAIGYYVSTVGLNVATI